MKPHWDHAFASGGAYKQPKLRGFEPLDVLLKLAEKIYGHYCIRSLWQNWLNNCVLGEDVRLGGNSRLINKNRKEAVTIGSRVICKGILRVEPTGYLSIGDEVYIGDNTVISSAENVTIGSGTLIAHGVNVFDNTSHPINWQERRAHFRKIIGYPDAQPFKIDRAPIVIGENCWLAMGSTVIKGVTIGDRSIVGAGCVVTKDVPPDTLVVGESNKHINLLDLKK